MLLFFFSMKRFENVFKVLFPQMVTNNIRNSFPQQTRRLSGKSDEGTDANIHILSRVRQLRCTQRW